LGSRGIRVSIHIEIVLEIERDVRWRPDDQQVGRDLRGADRPRREPPPLAQRLGRFGALDVELTK
jgi:hypothetical protein